MKKLALIALSSIAFLPVMASAITLEEAISSAYTGNPSLNAAIERFKSDAEQQSQAISGFLPELTLSGTRNAAIQKYQKTPNAEYVVGRYKNDYTTRSATLSQPIFNGGGSIAQVQYAKYAVKSSAATLRKAEQDLITNVVKAYLSLLQTQEKLNLNKNNVNTYDKFYKSTEQKFKLGESTRTEVAQSKAQLSSAQSNLRQAEADLDSAKANFYAVVGADPIELSTPPLPANIPPSIDEALSYTQGNNPDIEAAKMSSEALAYQVYMAKSQLLPTVSAQLQRSSQTESRLYPKQQTDSAVLQVNIPLYQSGTEYSKIRQTIHGKRQQEQILQNVINGTIANTNSQWNNYTASTISVGLNEDAVKASKLALSGISQEYKLGSRTLLDVLQTQQILFEAEVALSNTKFNNINNAFALKAAMGQLSPKELGLQVSVFDSEEYMNSAWFKLIGFFTD